MESTDKKPAKSVRDQAIHAAKFLSQAQKICPRCKETKKREEFNRSRRNSSGLQSWCKECQRSYNRRYDQRAREIGKAKPKRRKSKNDTVAINVSRHLYLLLAACAESEHETVDEYVDGVVRRHIKDHLIDYLVEM